MAYGGVIACAQHPNQDAVDIGPVSALHLDQGPDLGIRGTSQRIPQTR
jgi:hypothetical protein